MVIKASGNKSFEWIVKDKIRVSVDARGPSHASNTATTDPISEEGDSEQSRNFPSHASATATLELDLEELELSSPKNPAGQDFPSLLPFMEERGQLRDFPGIPAQEHPTKCDICEAIGLCVVSRDRWKLKFCNSNISSLDYCLTSF